MRPFTLGLFIISLAIFLSACASSGDANREAVAQPSATPGLVESAAATTPATPAPEGATPAPAPPQESEIRDAVARTYNDAVVFDPPRQGAQAQSREIAASRVPIVVAVSCSPGTFARDMRHLIDGGYRLLSVSPVDQFRYSAHVEIVGRLAK